MRVVSLLLGCMYLVQAAAFDAEIELVENWRFQPDPHNLGAKGEWYAPLYPDDEWKVVNAGGRWEDQGFPEVDGHAWYRRWVEIPESWVSGHVWLVLGSLNDAGTLYINGERINSYGDEAKRTMAALPAIAELSQYIRFGERNLIAIQVFDWGASGGLWKLPCHLTTEAASLPLDVFLKCFLDRQAERLTVEVDGSCLGNDRPDAELRVELRRAEDAAPFAQKTQPMGAGVFSQVVEMPLPGLAEGDTYTVRAWIQGPYAEPLEAVVASARVTCPREPAWAGEYSSLRVLNNFVTELLPSTHIAKAKEEHAFPNPREGWVLVRLAANGQDSAQPQAYLDGEDAPLVWRPHPETGALEAMRAVSEGPHRLRIQGGKGARLDVRTIPEIAFCYYPSGRHIKAYPDYDWPYVSRHILPNVNTLITRSPVNQKEFQQWLREGRCWLSNASLPGLGDAEPPTVDEVYSIWAANPGANSPGFAGMIVDEFLWSSAGHYEAWENAVKRLHQHGAFNGRTFYAWCGDLHHQDASLMFARALVGLGDRFAWERYIPEAPMAREALQDLLRELVYPFEQWREAIPGIERHMTLCLGYLSAPPETLNLNPAVDYHAFMDMQFHLLATDPAFWNVRGIMEYMAAYADEESLRYAHELIRHYCIEGQREQLNEDPYALRHIANPDFEDGLTGWKAQPAEGDSIAAGAMEGFSWLQGRYPKTELGNRFCQMRCSGKGPNRISQVLQSLEPGRLYSVKLIAAHLDDMHNAEPAGLHIDVTDAEILEPFGFECIYPSCYSHESGPYTRDAPAHFTFQRLVFRAQVSSATLTISDGPGQAGQTIAFNFVEVQPFHAP